MLSLFCANFIKKKKKSYWNNTNFNSTRNRRPLPGQRRIECFNLIVSILSKRESYWNTNIFNSKRNRLQLPGQRRIECSHFIVSILSKREFNLNNSTVNSSRNRRQLQGYRRIKCSHFIVWKISKRLNRNYGTFDSKWIRCDSRNVHLLQNKLPQRKSRRNLAVTWSTQSTSEQTNEVWINIGKIK